MARYSDLSFDILSNRGMVSHIVSGSLVWAPLDLLFWGCTILAVLTWLIYKLGSIGVGWSYKFFAGFVFFGLVGWVFLALFGWVSVVSLILVSSLVIILCVMFSFSFFGVSRVGLFLRLFFGAVFVGLLVEVAALVTFNIPVALNFDSSVVGLHWENVELSLSNLIYLFLPYLFLLFVFLGIVGFVVKALLPEGWLVSKISNGRFVWFIRRLSSAFELHGGNGIEFFGGRFVLPLRLL